MSASTMSCRSGEPERAGLQWLRWMLQYWWEHGTSALTAADVQRALEIADDAIEADGAGSLTACNATDPESSIPWVCTRPVGHGGGHVAGDGCGHFFHRWTSPTPDPTPATPTFSAANPFRDVPCGVQMVDGVARPVPWAGDPIPPNHEVVHRDELSRLRCQPDLEWHRRSARMDVPALVGIAIGAGIVVGYLICWLKGVS